MIISKYAQDGVDVVEGDSFSSFAGALCRATYGNCPFVEVRDFSRGHFRGPRGFKLKGLPEGFYMDATPDGDGTKVVVVDAAGDYDNGAYGWIAMVGGDVTRWGGKRLLLVNNFDTETIGKTGDPVNNACRAMMRSQQRICNEEGLVMYKGETAELPGSVTSPNQNALVKYLWSGVAIGAYNPATVITGDQVRSGMIAMALRELGFRNNGISSMRKAFAMKFGPDWYSNPEAQEAIKAAAVHAVLYDKFLETINGWFAEGFEPIIPSYLNVHLTGGALKSKFAEDILFPRGLSARLDNLWEPSWIMRQCAQWRGMTDEECYETWNGGQGEIVVIDPENENKFIDMAANFGIEAQCAGKITNEAQPSVVIESKFTGETISWVAK